MKTWLSQNWYKLLIFLAIFCIVLQFFQFRKLNSEIKFLNRNFDALDQRVSDLESQTEELQAFVNYKPH